MSFMTAITQLGVNIHAVQYMCCCFRWVQFRWFGDLVKVKVKYDDPASCKTPFLSVNTSFGAVARRKLLLLMAATQILADGHKPCRKQAFRALARPCDSSPHRIGAARPEGRQFLWPEHLQLFVGMEVKLSCGRP